MDWESFAPISGINQIVGHTQGADRRSKNTKSSLNICIDVGNASMAALLDGKAMIILRRTHNE